MVVFQMSGYTNKQLNISMRVFWPKSAYDVYLKHHICEPLMITLEVVFVFGISYD